MIPTLSIATLDDIESVLELQQLYLVTNLTDEQKKDGFVTTPFSTPQLIEVIGQGGLFVAKAEKRIVAYIFAASWEYFSQWPIFNTMIAKLPEQTFAGLSLSTENSFQYGPICIHTDFRGTSLLPELFEFMRVQMVKRYPIGLTFINKMNPRSLRAHTQKLHWTVIDYFEYNQHRYDTLAYDMHQSVAARHSITPE